MAGQTRWYVACNVDHMVVVRAPCRESARTVARIMSDGPITEFGLVEPVHEDVAAEFDRHGVRAVVDPVIAAIETDPCPGGYGVHDVLHSEVGHG